MPLNEKDLLSLPTNFVALARDSSEFDPKLILAVPPPLIEKIIRENISI